MLGRESGNFAHSGESTADVRNGDRAADDEGYVQCVDHFVAVPAFFTAADEVVCNAVIAA